MKCHIFGPVPGGTYVPSLDRHVEFKRWAPSPELLLGEVSVNGAALILNELAEDVDHNRAGRAYSR